MPILKAVIFSHIPVPMVKGKAEYNAMSIRTLVDKVKPFFKNYLLCRNIDLVYIYVDTGIRLTLKHLSEYNAEPIHYTVDELNFEQSTRNCLKLAVDESLNDLTEDSELDWKPNLAPIIQFIGLPHLMSLIHSLYKINPELIRLIAGGYNHFSYDSPKFVEAVIRIARGSSDASGNQYPIFRIDEDVAVNEKAIDVLLDKVNREMQHNLHQYSYFSGGYGRYNQKLDPVNDYAVRLHWLVNENGELSEHAKCFIRDLGEIGATQVTPNNKTSNVMSLFVEKERDGATVNRNNQQVISGAGLYMSLSAIKTLPPFMNFQTLTTWVDDHLKRRLHEALGHIDVSQIEHASEAKFVQNRHPNGITEKDLNWAKSKYFERLFSGCVMHSLIADSTGDKAIVAEIIDEILQTQSIKRSYINIYRSIRSEIGIISKNILQIWREADYGTNLLCEWARSYDSDKQVKQLTKDIVSYIGLVSRWQQYVVAIDRLRPVDAYWLFRQANAQI